MPLFSPEMPHIAHIRFAGGGDDARADLAACRASLRQGSRSFFAASLLLPRAVRDPACALYAFCRYADDVIDQDGGDSAAVARLHEQLDRIYSGQVSTLAADRALSRVVRQFAIPRSLLDALIEGFEWDVQRRRYEDLAALEAYAARVAGTVGAMMALVMGVRDPAAIARACDLGVAMQLTNIARDVGEDARAGRLYLPLAWLREAGIDPENWLAAPVFNDAVAVVVQRLLSAADMLYSKVDAGVAELPQDCRSGINAARFLYAEIGREIQRAGYDSVSQRAVVPPQRKLVQLARAFLAPLRVPLSDAEPPALAGTRFLVEAAAAPIARESSVPSRAPSAVPWWKLGARLISLIELFERLERVERSAQMERQMERAGLRS